MSGLRQFLDEKGLTGDCDLVSLAGAAKSIVDPLAPEHRPTLLSQIELAVKLHHISKLILMNHTDCGAYGGAAAFASPEAEHAKHVEELQAAKTVVLEQFPHLEVVLVLASLQEDRTVAFEEVA